MVNGLNFLVSAYHTPRLIKKGIVHTILIIFLVLFSTWIQINKTSIHLIFGGTENRKLSVVECILRE